MTIEAPAGVAGTEAVDALVEAVRAAVVDRTPLAIRGAGTKTWFGNRVDGRPLDVRANTGIVDYEPSELVLVARAGTPLTEIDALLAKHRQMLAFEPPGYAATASLPPGRDDTIEAAVRSRSIGATLGGCVAAGLSGPRRMAAGSVRDFVLGAKLIDGRGQHLSFGGRVMKNVAGYDVSRALVGSLGTLGVVTEVALKVLPTPEVRVTLAFPFDEAKALAKVNEWAGEPIPITATAWLSQPGRGRLTVRLEGSEAAVRSGIRRIGGLEVDADEADALWRDLREQTHRYFATRPVDASQWRLALPTTSPPLDATTLGFADQLVEWGGGQRWIATRVDPRVVREAAAALGGHATLWRAAADLKARHGAFSPLPAPSMTIQRRLKAEFDPHGLFNRGRLYPDL